MPELDPFDARLASAVRGFADRADTSVDAVAMAERAIGARRRRDGAFAWLGRPLPVSASMVLLAGLLLALFGWSVGSGGPWNRAAPAPVPAPSATPSPTPEPSPTPADAPDGVGDEPVVGTQEVTVVSTGTTARAGDVAQQRGVVAMTVDTMNDPRVTGTGTIRAANDSYGSVGPQWETYRLENAGGAWEGTCSGALWSGGAGTDSVCWLVGSGGYAGFTYYLHVQGTGVLEVDGIIFPGSPPAH
jgi:hypothetical protein